MRSILIAISAALIFTAAPGCAAIDKLLGGGGVIEQASDAERAPLRVIQASLIVRGAYATIEQQFDLGLLSASEALVLKAKVDKVRLAVETAAIAVERGAGGSELVVADEAIRALLLSDFFKERS